MMRGDLVQHILGTSATLQLVSLLQPQSLRSQATKLALLNGFTDLKTVAIVDLIQRCAIQMLAVFNLRHLRVLIQRVIAEFLIGVMDLPQLRL